MNLNPATVLNPVFQFLDWIIAEWGVYLFLAFSWLSVLVLAWVFSGGIGIFIQPHSPPRPSIIIQESDLSDEDMD